MEISEKLLERLYKSKKLALLTGAGVSAESGIKTFRDPDGLWAKFNPAELASVDGFMNNPKLVWDWYQHRRDIVNSSKPNPGHLSIAKMQDMFDEFTLITQNVDRLHQTAGSREVLELHGNIMDNFCLDCREPFVGETALENGELAKCNSCGGYVRPAVVWFGEMLPMETLRKAEIASNTCDVFFSVGTSGEVYPAAGLPIAAKQYGAYLVEVNPNETALSSYADEKLDEPSGIALPILLEKFEEYKKGMEK